MKEIPANKIFGTCSCVLSLLHCVPLTSKFYQRHSTWQLFPVLSFWQHSSSEGSISVQPHHSESLSCQTGLNSYLATLIISTPLPYNHALPEFLTNSSHHHCLASYSTSYLQELNRLPNCTSYPHYLTLTRYWQSIFTKVLNNHAVTY